MTIYVRKNEVQKTAKTLQDRVAELSALVHDSESVSSYCKGYNAALSDLLILLQIEDEPSSSLVMYLSKDKEGVKQ